MLSVIKDFVEMPPSIAMGTLAELFNIAHGSFLKEQKRNTNNQQVWFSVVNSGVPAQDKRACEGGVARYTFTSWYLMEAL